MAKKTKYRSETEHFERRSIERIGRRVSQKEIRALMKYPHKVEKQSLRVTVHHFVIDGIPCRVAYDKNRKRAITIIPEGAKGEKCQEEEITEDGKTPQ